MLTITTIGLILCAIAFLCSFIMAIEKGRWWVIAPMVLLIAFFFLFRLAVLGEMIPTPLYKIHPYI